ncbi:MAG: hypothetical protein HOI23_10920 [Deltaproteobacteria bacterium]|jgi:hypothetical protein|nr:hypothetical protein [Deltaproteobacteria bacterium]MBT6435327.1 hypothetical protein [Deltaproteobacteria bacterium]MBT6490612.1 hypothetical protein [Deltaproteobacteria bacterium]
MERKISPTPPSDLYPITAALHGIEKSKEQNQAGTHALLTANKETDAIDFTVPNGLFQEYELLFFRHGIRKTIAAELEQYRRHIHSTYHDGSYSSKGSVSFEAIPLFETINEHFATKATIYLQRKIKACFARETFEKDFAEAVEKWGELVSQEQTEHLFGIQSHALNTLTREKDLTRVHLATASRGFPRIFWLRSELEKL